MNPTLLIDTSNNSEQRYLTHSIFRYYGKYPPTSTRLLLEELWRRGAKGRVVDIMCGSGTTLLEAALAGHESLGIDVNPISILISRVKTEKSDELRVQGLLQWLGRAASQLLSKEIAIDDSLFNNDIPDYEIPTIDNISTIQEEVTTKVGRWFSKETSKEHAFLRSCLDMLPDSLAKRVVHLAWLRTIRSSSFASTRTGRLFLDKQKKPSKPFGLLPKIVSNMVRMQASLPSNMPKCEVQLASAMCLPDSIGDIETAFWHPPYFALYKYSSDVLRLELEWFGASRKQIADAEIREGFKTSNPDDAQKYLEDCRVVWQQLYGKLASGGMGVAINSDATLSKKRLNIFEDFATQAVKAGFKIEEIFKRPTQGTQSTYHRSKHADIKTNEDYIILFRKP